MKHETKRYTLVILDKEYNIVSDEPEERVMAMAVLVDTTMRALTTEPHQIDQHKLAVLSALQLASKLLEVEQQLSSRQKREEALVAWTHETLSTL